MGKIYILLGTDSAPHDCFAILMFSKTLVFALGTSLLFLHCLWPFLERFVKHVFFFWDEKCCPSFLILLYSCRMLGTKRTFLIWTMSVKACCNLKNVFLLKTWIFCVFDSSKVSATFYPHNSFGDINFLINMIRSL